MKASVFHKPGDIRYDTMPFPRILPIRSQDQNT
nr:hypothetical protein [Mucilaginibacter sp. E4BP6]